MNDSLIDLREIPLGAKADPRDLRDVLKPRAVAPVELPRSARVRDLPPIKHQGRQGSCTGHAVSWFWEQVLASRNMMRDELSPLFPWYYGRASEGNASVDSGVSMRAIMKAASQYGLCPLDLWPYDRPLDVEPNECARTYGQALRIPRYERCTGLDDIRYSIAAEDQSVCVGLPVYDSWYSDMTRRTGRVEMPSLSLMLGRHAMVICGYDDRKGELLAANCWGKKYGDDGFNHVPYEYLTIEGSVDAWTAGFDAIPDPAARLQRK